MTREQLSHVRKMLERDPAAGRVPHDAPKRSEKTVNRSEVTLGTILRRNRTYERGE